MDILKKLLSAINIFKAIEGVLISKIIGKGIKAALSALIGMEAVSKILPKLGDAGVSIDFSKLETWAVVAATGLFASIINWLKTRYKLS